jgi:GPH family glycoside/pentoside/hexuronide:cation symporter
LLFSTPNFGTTGKAIWVFIFYSLINTVFASFLNDVDAIYMQRTLATQNQQAKALAYVGALVMICSMAVSIALPQLMANWGTQPGGWTKIALVFAVPMGIIGLGRFFFLKETIADERTDKASSDVGFIDSWKTIGKNKYIIILSLGMLVANLVSNTLSVVGAYYFQYIVGDLGLMSLVGMLGVFAPFLMLLFPVAVRKIGGTKFVYIGLIVSILGNVLKFFAGANIPLLMAGALFAGLGTAPLVMLINFFLIQCMEYNEWKTGVRMDGLITAVVGFCNQVGIAISSGLIGLIMMAVGYDGTLAAQSDASSTAIVWLYSLIPAAFCLVCLLILRMYNLEKMLPDINRDLTEKHNAALTLETV